MTERSHADGRDANLDEEPGPGRGNRAIIAQASARASLGRWSKRANAAKTAACAAAQHACIEDGAGESASRREPECGGDVETPRRANTIRPPDRTHRIRSNASEHAENRGRLTTAPVGCVLILRTRTAAQAEVRVEAKAEAGSAARRAITCRSACGTCRRDRWYRRSCAYPCRTGARTTRFPL